MFVIHGEGLSRTLLYSMKCSAQPSTNSSLSVIRLFLFATRRGDVPDGVKPTEAIDSLEHAVQIFL